MIAVWRDAAAGTCSLLMLIGAVSGAEAQSAAEPPAPPAAADQQAPQTQPAPPPGMFFWPRPQPPIPQQTEEQPQGCTYRDNKLELLV